MIRSILWHNYDAPVSVLLMKNILGIMVSGYEIMEYFGEFRPKQCAKCEDWFEKSSHSEHFNNCNGREGVGQDIQLSVLGNKALVVVEVEEEEEEEVELEGEVEEKMKTKEERGEEKKIDEEDEVEVEEVEEEKTDANGHVEIV